MTWQGCVQKFQKIGQTIFLESGGLAGRECAGFDEGGGVAGNDGSGGVENVQKFQKICQTIFLESVWWRGRKLEPKMGMARRGSVQKFQKIGQTYFLEFGWRRKPVIRHGNGARDENGVI